MKPLAKSPSQTRNPTESLLNAPAYKSGWLYKRGLFKVHCIDKTESRESISLGYFFLYIE